MTNVRWTVVTLLFFAVTINYIDRAVIGVLTPVLDTALLVCSLCIVPVFATPLVPVAHVWWAVALVALAATTYSLALLLIHLLLPRLEPMAADGQRRALDTRQ